MTLFNEPPHHVGAHPSKTNHAKLHISLLSKKQGSSEQCPFVMRDAGSQTAHGSSDSHVIATIPDPMTSTPASAAYQNRKSSSNLLGFSVVTDQVIG
jgi:hypothetical protein